MPGIIRWINVRALLRDFTQIKKDLVLSPQAVYHFRSSNHKIIEKRFKNRKKGNALKFINHLSKLPTGLKVKRVELKDSDFLPKRQWKK